jgi:hypothetical protein
MPIHFYYDDHNPPHFHVRYGSKKAVFRIDTLERIEGKLPKKQELLVVQWAYLQRKELLEAWDTVVTKKQEPKKIKALS